MRKYLRLGLQKGYKVLFTYFHFKKDSKNPRKKPIAERYNYYRNLALNINKAFRVVPIVKGEENILNTQCFYTPNHQSVMDPIVLSLVVDKPISFVAKKEISTYPFVGNILKSIDGKFLDREDLRSELKVFKEVENTMAVEKDLSYVIFPEGTRSKRGNDFNLLPFHPGSFKIAMRNQLPIVPVCIYLTDRILNQKYHYKKYPVQITFLKPLYKDDYENLSTAQVSELVSKQIAEELIEMKKKDLELVAKLNKYSLEKAKKKL